MNDMHYNIGVLGARIFLGLLFFIQGYDKVFKLGVTKVAQAFRMELSHTILPTPLITFSAYISSYIELLSGLMLILGIFKYYALYALGIDLLMVSVAMGLISPLWDTNLVFPRAALVLLLLLLPDAWDIFSLDHLVSVSSR